MPTDLQIIDGFELLRETFMHENPGADERIAQPLESPSPERAVVEAWIQAIEGRAAVTGVQRRRVRALAQRIVQASDATATTESRDPRDKKLWPRAEKIPVALERAREKKMWPLAQDAPRRAPVQEAREWGRILPGLSGLRPWRLLERLGRPVFVPDAPTRRFLWRLGLLEQTEGGPAVAGEQVQSVMERIARLTGLKHSNLTTLVRWHIAGGRDRSGGGRCGAKPRCATCPLRAGCGWARFHPTESAADPDDKVKPDARRSFEPINRQVIAGQLDDLQEVELLATVLQTGASGIGAFELAETLLRQFGGLGGLDRAPVADLTRIRGISRGRAIQIKAALELGRRLEVRRIEPGASFTCSQDIWRGYRGRFRNKLQEHFVILLLDSKHRVIHDHIVSKGTLTGSLAHPREVFQEAVRHGAAAVIVLHNHPSGDPMPSQSDRNVTCQLREAGELLGIRVLDHIILGADDYYSFTDEE